jgi:hypothetical protein
MLRFLQPRCDGSRSRSPLCFASAFRARCSRT